MMMRRLMCVLSLCFLNAPLLAQSFAKTELFFGMHRIEAEVAKDDAARQLGLMNRSFLPPAQGMLFVFDTSARHCMWMKNTLIPLSVAFLDEEGKIINIEEMKPQTEMNHCAKKPARYALEMNAGWFHKRALTTGDAPSGLKARY